MSSLSGHSYTLELLNGSDRQCIDLMRMSKEAFVHICRHFRLRGWLHDSRYVTMEEKMAMFLNIIGQNKRYAVIKRKFQHSLYTIHIYFHEVLDAMMEFSKEVVIPTTFSPNPNVPSYIIKGYDLFSRVQLVH